MTDTTSMRQILSVARETLNGRLPERYQRSRNQDFHAHVEEKLRPGVSVLDVGSGRRPTVPVDLRPPGCYYVGLDLSAAELELAPPGSYDEMVACDATQSVGAFVSSFDLVLSWQVLEHVRPLDHALHNLYSYLRPGGRLVAEMSGTFSIFALADRVLPERVRLELLVRLLDREPTEIFPAYFHKCWYGALNTITEGWSQRTIVPLYTGADYLCFSRSLQSVYIAYEEWVASCEFHNLASYYRVIGDRDYEM